MKQFLLLSLLCFSLSACVIHIGSGSYKNPNQSDDQVFGDVHVASGQVVQNIKSVNGFVELSHRATAGNIESVNGNVEAGDWVKVSRIATINGNVSAGEHFSASEKVETINGNIRIDKNSRIGKNLQTINGNIQLSGVKVEGPLVNFNGNTKLTGTTRILGNLVYKKQEAEGNAFDSKSKPTLNIADSVTIDGVIILEFPVDLITDSEVIKSKIVEQF